MNRNADLPFFHGTSALAAAGILEHGPRNIAADLKLYELAGDVWKLIVARAGSPIRTGAIFEKAGFPINASIALENAATQKENSLASYGAFYASLIFRHACDYALRPAGSELLELLSIGFRVLDDLDVLETENLKRKYPDAMRAMDARSEPVVLKIQGIHEGRVSREDGNPECWPLIEYVLSRTNNAAYGSFRIRELRPHDVIEVFDIGDWRERLVSDREWRPSASELSGKGRTPTLWLDAFQRG